MNKVIKFSGQSGKVETQFHSKVETQFETQLKHSFNFTDKKKMSLVKQQIPYIGYLLF